MLTTKPNIYSKINANRSSQYQTNDAFLLSNGFLIIDTDQLLTNLWTIKGYNKSVIVIVKSNAYGLGAEMISKHIEKEVTFLCFMYCEEVKKLSQTYLIGTKVLILSASTQIEYEQIVKNGWEVCIHDINGLKLLDSVCRKLNKTIQIHVNIDTGMNRLGVKNIEEFANSLRSTKRVIPSGIMTHLVSSNNSEHIQGTTQQINKFRQHLSYFHSLGLTFRYQHVMNTNGVIQHNQILQANTIRPGIGLYYPCRTIRTKHSNMKPIFEYWGKIINIQSCHAGENIGYGFHHKLKNDSVIAVISVGYSDGIFRKQTNNKLSVKIDGYDCPMVGLTCMDCCFVDVTRLTRKPSVGQYVQITSNDPNSLNYVDHYLVSSNKSHHEFLCSISQHALRIEKNQFHRLINHR